MYQHSPERGLAGHAAGAGGADVWEPGGCIGFRQHVCDVFAGGSGPNDRPGRVRRLPGYGGRFDDGRQNGGVHYSVGHWRRGGGQPEHVHADDSRFDNDGPPKYSFQTVATSVTEGNSGSQAVGVAVVRIGSTAGTDSVICQLGSGSTATGGGTDYSFSNQTITFNPGDSGPKNCTVTVVGDTVTESNETIVLALVGSTGFGG
ncbi:MAG: hypothetical protein C4321_06195, partial [Chloroflexota bacterium]